MLRSPLMAVLFVFAGACACVQASAGRTFDVRAFGAVGDGTTNDRCAIQAAVDSCARHGGTVFFPAGTYLTGSIDLGDNTDLYLQQGAVILGSTHLADYTAHTPAVRSYNDLFLKYSLFYAEGRTNISLRGEGTIDGQGGAFRVSTREKPARYLNRPYVIRFISCRDVTVSGITLRNSAMWMQHYFACDGLVIRGIRVWNHANQNNDMMDIDGCRNVVIDDCIGDTEDDAITLKSTSPSITENVTITNCVISSHCNGIKTGTESTGGFRNITVSNVVVKPSAVTVAKVGHPAGISGITLATVDGGVLERISITNCTIDGPQVPIFIRLGDRARRYVPDAPAPGVGTVNDISISHITAIAGGAVGCSISGIPGHDVVGVRLSDISVTFPGGGTVQDASREPEEAVDAYPEGTHWGRLPAFGFFIRHARDVQLTNITVHTSSADMRPAVVARDVSDLAITGLYASTDPGAGSLIHFTDVVRATVRSSSVLSDIPCFLAVHGRSANVALFSNDLTHSAVPVCGPSANAVRMEGNLLRNGK